MQDILSIGYLSTRSTRAHLSYFGSETEVANVVAVWVPWGTLVWPGTKMWLAYANNAS